MVVLRYLSEGNRGKMRGTVTVFRQIREVFCKPSRGGGTYPRTSLGICLCALIPRYIMLYFLNTSSLLQLQFKGSCSNKNFRQTKIQAHFKYHIIQFCYLMTSCWEVSGTSEGGGSRNNCEIWDHRLSGAPWHYGSCFGCVCI